MWELVVAGEGREQKKLASMRSRAAETGAEIQRSVAAIMEDVRRRGYQAVEEYSVKFDGNPPREVTMEELEQAAQRIPAQLLGALRRSAEHIRAYQQELLSEVQMGLRLWDSPSGGKVGRVVRPLHRVGVYVPGGRAAYPSSVLMNVIPAKVAGVDEVVMVTPPTENLSDVVLAAAWVAGVDRCIAVGGAQAVAALTYGAGFIPQVDKLVGPGNAFVAEAKRMAYGNLDIDMVAGPSEVLVIADRTANPCHVAADLLSQAEHDPLASAVLLTDSMELAQGVQGEIQRQLGYLSRREIMGQSLENFGCAIVCPDLETCARLADQVAPEHMEIVTADPRQVMEMVHNAGAIFLGGNTPEPLGDYMAGPDHVLPTSGTARFFSPLSVDSFLKKTSVLEYRREDLEQVKEEIITLAQAEHLTAHANSIQVRFAKED